MDKKFKLFTVKHILDVTQTKSVVAKKDLIKGDIPYVTRTVSDNGYMGTCGNTDKINPGNCITIGAETGVAFYQPADFVAGNKVYRLSADDLTEKHYLYLAGALNKLTKNYSYSNARTPEKIKKEQILLPVIQDESGIPIIDTAFHYHDDGYIPDWQYMQDRIAELEQDRIAELDAYLKATGLEDYTLTEEDKEVLSLSSEAVSDEGDTLETDRRDGKIRFGKFKIGDLFEKPSLKFIPKRAFNKAKDISKIKTDEFDLPLVNAKHGDNGIMYYGRKSEWESVSMGIDIVADGAAAVGDVYVQSQETGILYNAYLIKLIEDIHSDRVLLYFAKCIEKITKEQFSYDKKATWEKVKECEISLPVTPDGDIDFDYMECYIRAIEKLTIADVVKYRDRELYAAKQAVC